MASISETMARPVGWLRGPSFDIGFVVGTTAVALASGAAVVANPKLFAPILFLDLWLLGYHHVIATYTRLCFDRASFQLHRFLILWLPFIVLAATLGLALGFGLWVLGSIYLYWQCFHYARQSWGVSQVYRRKSEGLVNENETLTKLAFYLLPLWGILHRSWQDPETFLGLQIKVIPVPGLLVDVVAVASIATLALWTVARLRAFWEGRGAVAHSLYMASHVVVFGAGYIFIEDITYGWLVINIWHNAQYLLFVWLFNSNRFREGTDPKAKFLSWISHPSRWMAYFGICFLLTTLLYTGIGSFEALFYSIGIPSMIVIYQAVNFHHYIVDSVIWKVRKAPLQKTLGLNQN